LKDKFGFAEEIAQETFLLQGANGNLHSRLKFTSY